MTPPSRDARPHRLRPWVQPCGQACCKRNRAGKRRNPAIGNPILARLFRLFDGIDLVERDGSVGRRLQRFDAAHQCEFVGAVGTEKAERARQYFKADIV